MLSDILKVNDPEKDGQEKYSQSRLYLFLTMLVVLLTCLVALFTDTSTETVDTVLSTLLTLVLIFAGYAIVGKGFKYGEIINKKL